MASLFQLLTLPEIHDQLVGKSSFLMLRHVHFFDYLELHLALLLRLQLVINHLDALIIELLVE